MQESRWASTYAVVVASGIRATGPVVVRVDSGVGLVGEVARVRSRVCGAVGARSGASRVEAAGGGVAASVARPAGVDVRVESVGGISGVRASGGASGAEASASVVSGG